MHRALRGARRAAGEVQQRELLVTGRLDRELGRLPSHHLVEVQGAGDVGDIGTGRVDEQDVGERRQLRAHGGDLLAVEIRRGHQRPAISQRDALAHRLRPERAEQRREHTAGLERADHRHVQPGHPPHQAEHAVAGLQAERAQPVGEGGGSLRQLAVGDVRGRAVLAQAAQRDVLPPAVGDVPVDCLMGDVDAPGRQAIQPPAGLVPGEGGAQRLVVVEVGLCVRIIGQLVDHPNQRIGGIHTTGLSARNPDR